MAKTSNLIFQSPASVNVYLDNYIRICFCQNRELQLANLISGHSTTEHFFTANQNTATSSHKNSAIATRSHGSCDTQTCDKTYALWFYMSHISDFKWKSLMQTKRTVTHNWDLIGTACKTTDRTDTLFD